MRKLLIISILFTSSLAIAIPNSKESMDSLDRESSLQIEAPKTNFDKAWADIESFARAGEFNKALDEKHVELLKSLSADQRFRLGDNLYRDGLIPRKLFYSAKNKPTLIQELIKSGKISSNEKDLHRLSLYLLSNLLVEEEDIPDTDAQ
ncbi:MAG: hypothetical protein VX642_12720 [Bdellovibrionota bacterium]|nr:hypothetical protein [Bdellovibrionota bacterium]